MNGVAEVVNVSKIKVSVFFFFHLTEHNVGTHVVRVVKVMGGQIPRVIHVEEKTSRREEKLDHITP